MLRTETIKSVMLGLLLISIISAISIAVYIPAAAEETVPPGFAVLAENPEAPDFILKDTAGKKIKLSEYRGKLVLLFFGTTW